MNQKPSNSFLWFASIFAFIGIFYSPFAVLALLACVGALSRFFLVPKEDYEDILVSIENNNMLSSQFNKIKNENDKLKKSLSEKNMEISNLQYLLSEKYNSLETETEEFNVVGLNYEGRSNKLKKMINDMKEDGEFLSLYEDLKGKELKEELEFKDKIYEIANYETVPGVYLEREANNPYDSYAIKVMISNDYDEFQVGYVPAKDAILLNEKVDDISECVAYIYGGKYKELDYLDEKIITKESYYGLNIHIIC